MLTLHCSHRGSERKTSCHQHCREGTRIQPNFNVCAGSAFGPDYAHHKGSAFGIYACGFDFSCQRDIIFQQLQPGIPFLLEAPLCCPHGYAFAAALPYSNRQGECCCVLLRDCALWVCVPCAYTSCRASFVLVPVVVTHPQQPFISLCYR